MANETFYNGEVRILYIKVSSVWLPVACLTSNPFNEESTMLGITTNEDGGWEASIPTNQNYSIDFTGIQMLTTGAGDTSKVSYDRLKVLKKSRTLINWKIENSSGTLVDEGFGYIQSINESNEVGGFLEFDGSIIGFGEPIFTSETGIKLYQDGEIFMFQNGHQFLFN